ncbi:cyclic nucleotide-binding domain-containing protein [bacterium]|nr:cyclic nucleotide-binding domain-containing protein [bacterium]MBU1065721.1 cyclic nucleotide-binding domain-containing protein [bacterium]MBU1633516.1 cyclic nucleotide-binding domain-containing protein [bacterium]MBU1874978.1 cyclic nucleotide-binding domain-containing protein [bacterium]
MREIHYHSGDTIIKEGSLGDTAYILKNGIVEVLKKTEHKNLLLATLEAEEIFGEMGLIEDKPRSASIIAKSEVVVDEITREDFMGLLEDKKSFIIPVLRAFFERLRQTNDLVVRLENQIGGTDSALADTPAGTVRIVGLEKEATAILKGKELVINKFPFKVGRNSSHISDAIFVNNDLYIDDVVPYNVSKNHMSINFQNDQFYILDRGSSLGTIVNGKQIGGQVSNYKVNLNPGENIVIIGSEASPYQFKITI